MSAGFSVIASTASTGTLLKPAIGELAWVLFKPREQLVLLLGMLNLRLRCVSLQGADEDNHIHPSVGKVGDCT